MEMEVIQGLGVSSGVAVGKAICLETRNDEVYRFPLPEDLIEEEIERFRRAAERAREEVHSLGQRVGAELGEELGAIFEAHALLLRDPQLLDRIEARIREEHVNAEWAVLETTTELRQQFARFQMERFRERGEDIQDVGRHLIRSIQGLSHHELSEIEGDVVVIADDLTPSDAVRLGRQGVVGFAIEVGGQTSHTAIIAHSLKIPLVTGLPGITRLAAHEDPVVVDGDSGRVILHPTDTALDEYREERESARLREEELAATGGLESVTRDGVEIRIMANIDLSEELDDALRYGARGIGLYRSEFLYIEKSPELPSEEDHYRLYRSILERMSPEPVILRTYDLGGRKLAREVMETREGKPVLVLRGIRQTLARPRIYREQLRGIFRAGCHGDLRVMLPLVSTLEEVRRFRAFAETVKDELDEEGIEYCRDFDLGIMIEVPSAALIADHLAREVDFFSIGTNDLIQYSLAADRNNEHVTDLYQPLHPGLLRMIQGVIEAADQAEIPVTVCGEMAGDPVGAAVLIGLGIRALSVSPRRIPVLKSRVRTLDLARLEEPVRRCLDLASQSEVEELLEEILEHAPETTQQTAS
ncbi:MAG: phosphoenolpyruvate--protein phosphotransferase [Thermoanaerobaculia bacterium]|nr:phosphoenolpyruvate--protein phosphotransferase [Thermoanaerobaculia bacterium]